MDIFKRLLVFVMVLATSLLPVATVTAETITVQQNITVVAVVAPAQFIILNSQNQIQQIISNSNISAQPIVLIGGTDGQEVPLTKDIYNSYTKILSTKQLQPGLIYKRTAYLKVKTTSVEKLDLSSI